MEMRDICIENIIGIYPAEFASEWENVDWTRTLKTVARNQGAGTKKFEPLHVLFM